MCWLAAPLQNHPEIALFLALGLGQAAAQLRIGLSSRMLWFACFWLAWPLANSALSRRQRCSGLSLFYSSSQ
jgi:hypothetical protein